LLVSTDIEKPSALPLTWGDQNAVIINTGTATIGSSTGVLLLGARMLEGLSADNLARSAIWI
jgi:ABC-type proline/glycine betaine transport system permease subunit